MKMPGIHTHINHPKKAQIWVSFVLYTLIGLAAIGLLLAIAQPKIAEIKDSITIKQTIEALSELDTTLRSTLIAAGNIRTPEFRLVKGELIINADSESIVWKMQSKKKYSQPEVPIQEGSLTILTKGIAAPYEVSLTLDYSGVADIQAHKPQITLSKAASPYKIVIKNLGSPSLGELQGVEISIG